VSRLKDWLLASGVLLVRRRERGVEEGEDAERIVPKGGASPGSELVVVLCLVAAAICAVAFRTRSSSSARLSASRSPSWPLR
jgi:hypothetical protein